MANDCARDKTKPFVRGFRKSPAPTKSNSGLEEGLAPAVPLSHYIQGAGSLAQVAWKSAYIFEVDGTNFETSVEHTGILLGTSNDGSIAFIQETTDSLPEIGPRSVRLEVPTDILRFTGVK